MIVYCDNEKCEEQEMEIGETDSRQEWVEETYQCPKCDKIKIHKTEFNQNGLVIRDELEDEDKNTK